jgi:hypothetical protein
LPLEYQSEIFDSFRRSAKTWSILAKFSHFFQFVNKLDTKENPIGGRLSVPEHHNSTFVNRRLPFVMLEISDHQQSWGYEEGPWKGPGPPLLMVADSIHKPPASNRFAPIKQALAVTVEPFKFSPA